LSPEVEVTVGLTEPYVFSEAHPNPLQNAAEVSLTVREAQQFALGCSTFFDGV